MGFLRAPKPPAPVPTPDPNDLENRRDDARRGRMAKGGVQSTLITRAVDAARGGSTPAPSATATGLNRGG